MYTFDSTHMHLTHMNACNLLSVGLDMPTLGGVPLGSGHWSYVGLLWALTRQWQQQRWSLDTLCEHPLM